LLEKQRKLNSLIQEVVNGNKLLFYLDMHYPFFTPEGTLMQDIFVADKLHLNEKGYGIFANQIKNFIQQHKVK
jgi:lysophospholipase L1-like esterase